MSAAEMNREPNITTPERATIVNSQGPVDAIAEYA